MGGGGSRRGLHFLSLGSRSCLTGFTGSWMVIAVNGWMNHPRASGCSRGQVVDVHPVQALFANSYFWHELVHMYLAAYMVTGFVFAGVYASGGCADAWTVRADGARDPVAVAALAAPVQVLVGDWNGREVARRAADQTGRLRRTRADRRRERRCICSAGTRTAGVEDGIEIPRLLSLLAYHDPNATVRGLDSVPAADRPPVNVVRVAFQFDGRDRHDACGAQRRILRSADPTPTSS